MRKHRLLVVLALALLALYATADLLRPVRVWAQQLVNVTGMGEVQLTPTAYTLLGRLSDIGQIMTDAESDTSAMRLAVNNNRVDINVARIGDLTPVAALCDDPSKVLSVNLNAVIDGVNNSQVVALAEAQVIYVCGYTLGSNGAATVQWIYGTGAACATGETDLETLIFDNSRGYGVAVPNGGALQFKTPAGNALCLETSASVTVFGRVSYVKQ